MQDRKSTVVKRNGVASFPALRCIFRQWVSAGCVFALGLFLVHIAFSAHSPTTDGTSQEQPGFWGIQYIGKFNFRYTVFYICGNLGIKHSLTTNLGEKYTVVFLILVFYMSFSLLLDSTSLKPLVNPVS